MQGRLSVPLNGRIQAFPAEHWQDEFPRAAEVGLDSIEWIYDLEDADNNPIASELGIERMWQLSTQHGVAVRSLCADYFMSRPLMRASDDERAERLARLEWLLHRSHRAGIKRVVLPFVDASRIETERDRSDVVEALAKVKPLLDLLELEVHLETALGPEAFRSLLKSIAHPRIKVNYDSGNSASQGFDPRAEWLAYGTLVGSVHIKDRIRGGGTVPLGSGDTDFEGLFAAIGKIGYRGPWILQTARGAEGQEVPWAIQNRDFLTNWLERMR